ncbi:MAG: ABC transporter permease [Planctomycetota bacterium]|nr:ABC transporter permease [Planctomycetota bacterium]
MIGLIARRLAQAPLILLAIYTITFVLAWALPGSAVLNDEGRRPPPEVIAAMEARYNLDDPASFYLEYLYRASGAMWAVETVRGGEPPAFIFDFGPSFRYEDWSVNELIASSLPVSVTLGLAAIVLALAIGVTAGIIGALRPNSPADVATLAVALIGISLPSFVVGTLLLMIFPVWLGVGTVGGWGRPQDMILPAVTLSLPFAAYIARLTRMGMIDVLGADYIRTARAKGVPGMRVVTRHALKNAFLPVLSYLGPACAFAMTGSFVVERVFNVPGIGQHFVNAVKNKDLFVIMGITLIYSGMLILLNLLVDVLYRWVDPRIDQS